ncbi:MAG: MBL fold metallo-hydrolase [Bacteroidota bacterium]|jgi:metallo-beta-lactamase family protein
MILSIKGAAKNVTGSKHLITTNKGKKILLDCGLYQNSAKDNEELNRHFGFNPADIDAVILSHAHIDHSGNLPLLVKQGFTGKIYATPATRDLCEIMLLDSAHIHESDIVFINKRRLKAGKSPLKPLYTVKDAGKCMKHFYPIPYNNEFIINEEVSFNFTDAGHILGSAVINLSLQEENKTIKLCYTGDIGRPNDLIIKAPEHFPQADYIICESTYGNRLHDDAALAGEKLLQIVRDTCITRKGKLLIPAFSLGRTQEIVYTLDCLKTQGLLPPVKVFVDSPLSMNATEIMRKYSDSFNDTIKHYMEKDDDPFGFNNLVYVQDAEESKALNDYKEPCIIISASGMMEAGRIKHHLHNNIGKENCTLLIVGFVPPNSLGHRLLRGDKQVKIFGEVHDVKINIAAINSYSAHADYNEMIQFLSCQQKQKIKKIFLVHGNEDVMYDFKIKLMEAGFNNIEIPDLDSFYELH